MKTRGHLFNHEKPTLACNQERLCDQIDTMLQELDGKDINIQNLSINNLPFRGRQNQRFGNQRFNRARGRSTSNPRFRPPFSSNRSESYNCRICLEARRYDAAKTHNTANHNN